MVRAAVLLLAVLLASPAGAAGFQYGSAPDPDDQPIELGIWYPSDAAASTQTLGLFKQEVAPYGAVAGDKLPLIVISHGTGGGAASHYDTALALANAGFVVVAPSAYRRQIQGPQLQLHPSQLHRPLATGEPGHRFHAERLGWP